MQRLRAQIVPTASCHLWMDAVGSDGYGKFWVPAPATPNADPAVRGRGGRVDHSPRRGVSAGPPARKLERPLAAWLATLDPDEVDPAHPLPWTFSELGWRIEFLAFPIPVEHRGTLGRTVEPFMSAIGTTVVDHWVLRSRLEEKSPNKYGVSGRPYVVAVDEDSWQHSDAELHRAEALFGDRSIRYSAGNVQWGTAANGFWYPTRRTACSAVLLVGHLKPWNALNQTPELWLNPWADTPMPATLPHWRIRRLALDEQRHHHVEVTEPTMTPREFWGDSYGWWFDVNAAN